MTPAEGRKFALTLAVAFTVVCAILVWRGHDPVARIAGALAALLALAGLLAPARLGPVERAWMALARAISRVTTPIVLGIVFYVVLTPVGLVMRGLGRDPLGPAATEGSLWVRRTAEEGRGTMRNQF